jgi:glycosyltransferase involved in cell wall biosynthesis
MPKLSILIPTFNRSSLLKQCLNSIKLNELNNQVEIIVCDNKSTDKTQTVCDEFTKKMGIRYIKNKQNYGFDYSVKKLYSVARGEYVLFIADDVILNKHLIFSILRAIKENNPDLIGLESYGYISNPSEISFNKIYQSKLLSREEYLIKCGLEVTTISSHVIKKIRDKLVSNDSHLSFTRFMFENLMLSNNNLYLNGTCLINKKNSIMKYDYSEVLIKGFFDIFNDYQNHISEKTIKKFKNQILLSNYLLHIHYFHKDKVSFKKAIEILRSCYKNSTLWKFFIEPILIKTFLISNRNFIQLLSFSYRLIHKGPSAGCQYIRSYLFRFKSA